MISSDSADAVLGIDSDATDAEKKEFYERISRNDRLNSLEPGDERDNARECSTLWLS